ncbi:hypothetical protein [Bacillus sp. AK031]
MFSFNNHNVMDRLLKSTILSTILSMVGITLTIYHHYKVTSLLISILHQKNTPGE